MLLGVPLHPLIVVGGVWFIVSMWTSILLLVGLLPLVLLMRQITKADDNQFRALGLRFYFRVFHINRNGRFWRASAYSPLRYFRRFKR